MKTISPTAPFLLIYPTERLMIFTNVGLEGGCSSSISSHRNHSNSTSTSSIKKLNEPCTYLKDKE